MDRIGKGIVSLVGPYLQAATFSRPLVGDATASLCKSLVAMPVRKSAHLFTFDYNGAPEHATAELPFVSMGSGQTIADPFLALLNRLLWSKRQPTLSEGRLAAVWTVDHVRLTNPGGVGGDIQLATLSATSGEQPVATFQSEGEIGEHLQQARSAEEALVNELRAPAGAAEAFTPPPSLPGRSSGD